ncbi:hypothetical protein [Streptomyces daliensis]|uniref:Uncharacterized protein n=1 Tax=Streptomyces daliensis TaxID=299421 RepID=A0A8T4IVZ3_9ACTN|nr:hypothetical protein [Streptomyces daliensis]
MDDHGDDFGKWFVEDASYKTEEQWASIAGHIRHAVNKVSPEQLPVCLPGEPQECGRSAQQHALAWAARLKAAAHHMIEQYAPSPARAAHVAGPLYQRYLSELRADSSGEH